jgi:hypothetical protein
VGQQNLWTVPKFDPMVAEEDMEEVVQLDGDDDSFIIIIR